MLSKHTRTRLILSNLRAVLDRINDVEATISRIEMDAGVLVDLATQLTLESLVQRRMMLRDELAEISNRDHVEICDYRIIPQWDGGKKRRAHRVIMEKIIGRSLRVDEHVHHKDKNPLNNDPANLELMPKAEHERLHGDERQRYPDTKTCAACGSTFKANPRKRLRHKCCSQPCAQSLRIAGRKAQSSRKSRQSSSEQQSK